MAYYEDFDDFLDFRDDDDEYEPDLPEYMGQIEEIINAEVERRLDEKVADIEKLRQEQETYRENLTERSQKIGELQKELNAAQRAVADAEKKLQAELDRKRTEAFNDLTNGWHEVSEAFMIEEETSYIECPVCNGDNKITRTIDGNVFSMDCPICWNRSEHIKYRKSIVRRLSWYNSNDLMIIIDKNGKVFPAVHYNWASSTKVDLNTCYRTREEAQAEADRRTAESRAKAEEKLRKFIEEKGYGNLVEGGAS